MSMGLVGGESTMGSLFAQKCMGNDVVGQTEVQILEKGDRVSGLKQEVTIFGEVKNNCLLRNIKIGHLGVIRDNWDSLEIGKYISSDSNVDSFDI